MKNKFKVGDIVMVVRAHELLLSEGSTHTVTYADDDFVGFSEDRCGEWYADRFELVTPAPATQWFVSALTEAGELMPASRPRRMASEAQACAVAKIMAKDHPGRFATIAYVVGPTFEAVTTTREVTETAIQQV